MPNKHITIVATSTLIGDQRLQRIAQSLHQAGYGVLLLGRCFQDSAPLPSFPFLAERLVCQNKKGPLAYLEFNFRLLLFLLFHNTHIICAVDADTLVPAKLAARLKGLKIVFDAHEWFSEVPEVIHRKRVQSMWKWVERSFIPNVDAAYTVSASLAKKFTEAHNVPFSLVRNMPLTQTIATASQDIPNAIYAGAVNEGRGIELMAEIAEHCPIPILICGNGDLFQKFSTKQIPNISFLGFLPPNELTVKIQQASIGILILDATSPSYYFSLANKFFDYVQAGIPVIFPPLPEYLALNAEIEVGIHCQYNAADLLEAIKTLTYDTELYNRLKSNTMQAAKIWNWEQEQQTLLAIYSKL